MMFTLVIFMAFFVTASESLLRSKLVNRACHPRMAQHDISDKAFEDLLMQPSISNSDIEPQTKSPPRVSDYYTEVLSMFGKLPISRLRTFISKYDATKLPPDGADTELCVEAAVECMWNANNGDWPGLLLRLKEELGSEVDIAASNMAAAVAFADKLSETRIKELIKLYSSLNALPKLDKRKYVGKFLKGDYIATLLDILREDNQNDYGKVASVLEREASKRAEAKKGFGS